MMHSYIVSPVPLTLSLLILLPLLYYLYRFTIHWLCFHASGAYASFKRLPPLPVEKRSVWYPIVGDILSMRDASHNSYLFLHRCSRQVGDLINYRWWIFHWAFAVLNHPDDIYAVLASKEI